jgi:hypothetical protein
MTNEIRNNEKSNNRNSKGAINCASALCLSVQPPALAGQVPCFSVKFIFHRETRRTHRGTQSYENPSGFKGFC